MFVTIIYIIPLTDRHPRLFAYHKRNNHPCLLPIFKTNVWKLPHCSVLSFLLSSCISLLHSDWRIDMNRLMMTLPWLILVLIMVLPALVSTILEGIASHNSREIVEVDAAKRIIKILPTSTATSQLPSAIIAARSDRDTDCSARGACPEKPEVL